MSLNEIVITVSTEDEEEVIVEEFPDISLTVKSTPDVIVLAEGGLGLTGPKGDTGDTGPMGPTGPPGASNAAYIAEWTWTTKITDAATAGQVGVNNALWTAATQVNLNQQKTDNSDVSAVFPKIKIGDEILIQQKTDSTRWIKYTITGLPTDHGTWWSWPVNYEESNGIQPNGNAPTIVGFLVQGAQVEEWLGDSGIPANDLGRIGDWYLNLANGDVYEKTDLAVWTLRGNIKGPPGQGIPVGGATGQALVKNSGADYDSLWATIIGLPGDVVVAAAMRIITNKLLAGDSQPAWQVRGDGRMDWGPGGSTPYDTNLYRSGAGTLRTDSLFMLHPSAANAVALASLVGAESISRFVMYGDGKLEWGSGTLTRDVALYRAAADILRTDDRIDVKRTVAADLAFGASLGGDANYRYAVGADGKSQWGDGTAAPDLTLWRIATGMVGLGTASQKARLVIYGDVAGAGTFDTRVGSDANARFLLQAGGLMLWGDGTAAQDTYLQRLAAGVLALGTATQTGTLRIYGTVTNTLALQAWIASEAQSRFTIRSHGLVEWGDGTLARDTNLYRSAPDRLKTDDLFDATTLGLATKVKAGAPVDADWAAAPPDGTVVFNSTGKAIYIRAGGTWQAIVGIPAGGTAGQELVKNSNADYDVIWQTPSGGAGAGTIPIGAVLDWPWIDSQIPSWALLPYGQLVTAAAYPALQALADASSRPYGGSAGVNCNLPDYRGCIGAGKDNMGGTTKGKITAAISGTAGTVLGAIIGSEGVALTTAQLPAHTHTFTSGTESADHTHTGNTGTQSNLHYHLIAVEPSGQGPAATVAAGIWDAGHGIVAWSALGESTEQQSHYHSVTTGGRSAAHTHSGTTDNSGSGGTHLNMQPTIIVNKMMRAL